MTISEKIASIKDSTLVSELDDLLSDVTISVTWLGYRMIHIKGYEKPIKIEEIAIKFLESFKDVHKYLSSPEKEKQFYSLYGKIIVLYTAFDELNAKNIFYKGMDFWNDVPFLTQFFSKSIRAKIENEAIKQFLILKKAKDDGAFISLGNYENCSGGKLFDLLNEINS